MNYIYSSLSRRGYLDALRQRFENPLNFFDERVTGVVFGSFFSVAHYQEYEWNRRITSECNRAYGYVRESHGELEIRFIRGKGMLSPSWLLVWIIMIRLVFLAMEIGSGYSIGIAAWLVSAAIALLVCAISAFHSSITDKGVAGAYEIDKLLTDPENYYC